MGRPMPSKRQILDLLTRPELQAIADEHGLEVADRRVNDQLIDAAVRSRKVVLADVLMGYTRDRLKELCRELKLDDRGKEKAILVARLVGANSGDWDADDEPPPRRDDGSGKEKAILVPRVVGTNS